MQGNLFGQGAGADAYGAPLAARNDPPTSAEAGRRHKASGRLGAHAEIALRLVKRFPGSTRCELWAFASEEERRELGDETELMRRLGGLKGNHITGEGKKVEHGPMRKCSVKHTKMVTWVLVKES